MTQKRTGKSTIMKANITEQHRITAQLFQISDYPKINCHVLKSGDESDIRNYRPIAILNFSRK